MSMATLMISTGQAQALAQHLTPAQRKHLPVSILPKPNPIALPKKTAPAPKPSPPEQTTSQHPSAPPKRIKDVVKSARKHKTTVRRKQTKKASSIPPPTTKARTPSPSGSGDESDCPLVIDEYRETTSAGTDGDGFQKARKTARLPVTQQARGIASTSNKFLPLSDEDEAVPASGPYGGEPWDAAILAPGSPSGSQGQARLPVVGPLRVPAGPGRLALIGPQRAGSLQGGEPGAAGVQRPGLPACAAALWAGQRRFVLQMGQLPAGLRCPMDPNNSCLTAKEDVVPTDRTLSAAASATPPAYSDTASTVGASCAPSGYHPISAVELFVIMNRAAKPTTPAEKEAAEKAYKLFVRHELSAALAQLPPTEASYLLSGLPRSALEEVIVPPGVLPGVATQDAAAPAEAAPSGVASPDVATQEASALLIAPTDNSSEEAASAPVLAVQGLTDSDHPNPTRHPTTPVLLEIPEANLGTLLSAEMPMDAQQASRKRPATSDSEEQTAATAPEGRQTKKKAAAADAPTAPPTAEEDGFTVPNRRHTAKPKRLEKVLAPLPATSNRFAEATEVVMEAEPAAPTRKQTRPPPVIVTWDDEFMDLRRMIKEVVEVLQEQHTSAYPAHTRASDGSEMGDCRLGEGLKEGWFDVVRTRGFCSADSPDDSSNYTLAGQFEGRVGPGAKSTMEVSFYPLFQGVCFVLVVLYDILPELELEGV
ncbi:proteoglycan 4-like [Schistocerca americana]|uniref:proteoglycan 4-like n=1 Tax=Schistocerca americana TaxID=7009 RepID=UPI001F4FED33|nr:proteoglycan 4-like [Schistocerca americana]